MTTLKLQQNSNYEKKKKTQTQNVKKLKLWQNSRSQIVKKKLKNSNIDKTWNLTNLNFRRRKKLLTGLLVSTFLHLDNQWYVLWAAFCDSRDVFFFNALVCYFLSLQRRVRPAWAARDQKDAGQDTAESPAGV